MTAGPASWRQIVAVGFGGGLAPCPAALVVLVLCLQAGASALGVALVAAFSLGLAVVLVGVGLAAALSLRFAGRFGAVGGQGGLARALPWASVAVMALAGGYTIVLASLALGGPQG